MRQEVHTQVVPLGDMVTNKENGESTFVPNGETVTVSTIDIYADTEKIFMRDGKPLSNHITIGTDDSVSNYTEINEIK